MSEQIKVSSPTDIPPEMVGAYTTWRSPDGSDSNRHTYLIDEEGKKRVISRKAFEERFESKPYGPPIPKDQYWVGNQIFYGSDPNRIPYAPAQLPEKTTVEPEKEKKGRGVKLRLGQLAAGGAILLGSIFGVASQDRNSAHDNHNAAPAGQAATELAIEAVPSPLPEAPYEIVDADDEVSDFTEESSPEPSAEETVVAQDAAASATSTEVPTAEAAVESTPEETPEPTATATPSEESPAIVPHDGIYDTYDPETDSNRTGDNQTIQPVSESNAEAEVSNDADITQTSETASESDTPEAASTIDVLIAPVMLEENDGITQVLSKILQAAGYTDISPEQLFTMYEELVTNPTLEIDGIFEGATLVYNSETGEYWIVEHGGTEVSLTPEAAQVLWENFLSDQEDDSTIRGDGTGGPDFDGGMSNAVSDASSGPVGGSPQIQPRNNTQSEAAVETGMDNPFLRNTDPQQEVENVVWILSDIAPTLGVEMSPSELQQLSEDLVSVVGAGKVLNTNTTTVQSENELENAGFTEEAVTFLESRGFGNVSIEPNSGE